MRNPWPLSIRREPVLVIVGATLLLAALTYLLLFRPLSATITKNEQEIRSQRQLLMWMEEAANKVKQLKSSQTHLSEGAGAESALSLINQSAKDLQLEKKIKRLEPTEEKGVRVWLDEVSFDTMLSWLAGLLERDGLIVSDLSVDRAKGEGQVNAVLTLSFR